MIPHALREAWAALEAENERLRALADAVRAEHAAMRRIPDTHESVGLGDVLNALTERAKAHAAVVAALAALAPPPVGRCIEAEYDYVRAARREAKEGRKP